MAVIFWFSSAPSDESADMSLTAGRVAARIFVPGYGEWTQKEQETFAEKIDYPVRKTAHAAEYALLGILLTGTFGAFGLNGKKWVTIVWVCSAAYAASDELHQYFVPGRSCQLSDVILDSAGAAAGILLYLFCRNILDICGESY